jgi:Flp pilus assembly protein TadD
VAHPRRRIGDEISMKRDQWTFLGAGVVLGFVIGFVVAWGIGGSPAPTAAASLGAPAPMGPPAPAAPPAGDSSPDATMGEVRARLASLREAIDKNPTDAAALLELGSLYMQINRYDEARTYLERAVAASPSDVHALTHLGIALAESGDLPGARQRFERTVGLEPDYWQGWFYVAVTCARIGDVDAARRAVARLETLQPDLPELAELKEKLARSGGGSSAG